MNKEKGAVLPFIAISLILIITMLAFVVDFSSLVTTKSDMRETARAAAIAGLQAYIEDLNSRIERSATEIGETDPVYEQALQVAIEKASVITKFNLELAASSKLRAGNLDDFSVLGHSGESNFGGYLIPGKWHFIEGNSRPSCSPQPPAAFEPCFEELAPNKAANAMRVVISDESGKVRSSFSHVIGASMAHVSDFGTAAFIPRQGVVAFDLSASTTRVTHLDNDTVNGKRAEYAFYVDPSSSCSSAWQSSFDSSYQEIWDNMLQNPPGASKDHYRDDYQCINLEVEGITESFGIEQNGTPQPLNSILDATHELLTSFAQRRVVGDKVGAFGFDLDVLAQRRLPETPINGEILASPIPGEAGFDQFLDATDTSIVITDARRKDKFLFPRVYSGPPSSRQVALTNIQVALNESLKMLKSSDTFEVADNFVLLITDGLTNCVENPDHAPLKGADADGDGQPDPIMCFNTNDSNFSSYNENYIRAGFQEIYNTNDGGITKQFSQDGVKIHVALVGDNVAPHMLVRKSSTGGCMNFSEASASHLSMVDATDTEAYGIGEKFYFPNNYSLLSATTGGKWRPIRFGCSASLTDSSLADICDSRANSNPIIPSQVPGLIVDPNQWDNQGRLLCDPGADSIGSQLNQLVKEIMSDSPIVLVE